MLCLIAHNLRWALLGILLYLYWAVPGGIQCGKQRFPPIGIESLSPTDRILRMGVKCDSSDRYLCISRIFNHTSLTNWPCDDITQCAVGDLRYQNKCAKRTQSVLDFARGSELMALRNCVFFYNYRFCVFPFCVGNIGVLSWEAVFVSGDVFFGGVQIDLML